METPFVEIDFVVKTYDVDMAQIVHNAVYIRWLEDLRTALMDKYLPLQHWMARDLMPVLLETRISYRRAVKLFDPVHGRLEMPRFGPVKWAMDIHFTVNGELRAEAHQLGCFINMKTMRATPIPEDLRALFSRERTTN
jgi:acyl-CoA thioester hydrolase